MTWRWIVECKVSSIRRQFKRHGLPCRNPHSIDSPISRGGINDVVKIATPNDVIRYSITINMTDKLSYPFHWTRHSTKRTKIAQKIPFLPIGLMRPITDIIGRGTHASWSISDGTRFNNSNNISVWYPSLHPSRRHSHKNVNRKKIASAEFHRGLPDTFHSRFINRFAKQFTIKHIRTPHEYFRHLTPMIPGYWCVSEKPQSKRRTNTKTTLLLRAVSVSVEPINRSFGKAVSFVLLYYRVVLCSGRWWTVGSVCPSCYPFSVWSD